MGCGGVKGVTRTLQQQQQSNKNVETTKYYYIDKNNGTKTMSREAVHRASNIYVTAKHLGWMHQTQLDNRNTGNLFAFTI